MRNPPPDDGPIGINEETLSIYLAQLDSIKDEPGIVGFLKGIVGNVSNGFPAPVGDPQKLRDEAQRYVDALDAATRVKTTLLAVQADLDHGLQGATGDAVHARFTESVHKVDALIDDYQVGCSVLRSYAAALQSAQTKDADGRAQLATASSALAPLPDYEALSTPQVRAVLPGALQAAKVGCRQIFDAVGSLGGAFIDARSRLNIQMQASQSVLGGVLPDIDSPAERRTADIAGKFDSTSDASGAVPAAGVAPGFGGEASSAQVPDSEGRLSDYPTGVPDGVPLAIVVPPVGSQPAVDDRRSSNTAVPRSGRGDPVSGSPRDPDDNHETAIAPAAGTVSVAGATTDSAQPVPSPSPGPAPVTPRPEHGTTAGPSTP